jgi:hypothetical protein
MLRYKVVGIDLGLNRMLVLFYFVWLFYLCFPSVEFDEITCCATISINIEQANRRAQDATRRSIRAVVN